MSRRSATCTALLTACLLLPSCSGDGAGPAGPPPPNADSDGDGFLNSVDGCPNGWRDEDGCPDDTLELYASMGEDIEAYATFIFTAARFVYQPVSAFTYYSSATATPCGEASTGDALYCPTDETVYFHRPLLDDFLTDIGEAASGVIIAHELGHHAGNVLGAFDAIELGTFTIKQLSLLADCLAGAWAEDAVASGFLVEPDVPGVFQQMLSTGEGDPSLGWFDPEIHGSSAERLDAFDTGFTDVISCLDFL